MIYTIKIVVTILVFAFIVYGIIDYAIAKRKEEKRNKNGYDVQGNATDNAPEENGQQEQNDQQGENRNADNRKVKDVRYVFIREIPELRIYGLLPYSFYLLALASLFLVYLTWHGVRKDIRAFYELKNKGNTECVADSVKCRTCACFDSFKKEAPVGEQRELHDKKAASAK